MTLEILDAPETDLVSLEDAKAHLQVTGTDDDAAISALIARASAAITSYIGAPMLSGGYRETFETGCGQTYLILSRTPVSSITSVAVDSTVLSENESRLDSSAGLLARLANGRSRPWEARAVIVVEYEAGYETTPADIQQAALTLIAADWSARGRDPGLRNIGIGSITLGYFGPDNQPGVGTVAHLLNPYRTVGMG